MLAVLRQVISVANESLDLPNQVCSFGQFKVAVIQDLSSPLAEYNSLLEIITAFNRSQQKVISKLTRSRYQQVSNFFFFIPLNVDLTSSDQVLAQTILQFEQDEQPNFYITSFRFQDFYRYIKEWFVSQFRIVDAVIPTEKNLLSLLSTEYNMQTWDQQQRQTDVTQNVWQLLPDPTTESESGCKL